MRKDFVGAIGITKIALRLDPRDKRSDADHYDASGDGDGGFGCLSPLGCEDVCPRDPQLQTQIAVVRRKMIREGLSWPAASRTKGEQHG